jgi:hypothetical protein
MTPRFYAQHPRLRHASSHLEPQRLEALGDKRAGALFLKSQLWPAMECAPKVDDRFG